MIDTNVVRHRPDVPDGDPPLVDEQLADELLARAQAQGVELLGPDGLLSQVTKSVLERALGEELTEHLGYDKHDPVGRGSGNSRNGSTPKRLLTEVGPIDLAVPRDRAGSFEPQIVRKGQTRLDGFNDRIVALYARGMTTRDIRGHLREMYQVDVSPDLVSRVTDAVVDELQEWQARPLDPVYPVVFIDALMVKIRDGVVANRPVYLAIGIDCEGVKQVLGLWVGPAIGESSKFWLTVLSELRSRGLGDVCIVCCDGLTGLPEAIGVVWPAATVQLCVVHLIRAWLRYASKKGLGAAGQGPADDLHRHRPGRRRGWAGGVRAAVGPPLPRHRQAVADPLERVRAVSGVPATGAARGVHDKSDRVDERSAAKGHPQPRPVPLRTGSPKSAVPGRAQSGGVPLTNSRHEKLELENGTTSVHDLLRGTHPNTMTATITYTDGPTLPSRARADERSSARHEKKTSSGWDGLSAWCRHWAACRRRPEGLPCGGGQAVSSSEVQGRVSEPGRAAESTASPMLVLPATTVIVGTLIGANFV